MSSTFFAPEGNMGRGKVVTIHRVNGGLAVSRAMGNARYKLDDSSLPRVAKLVTVFEFCTTGSIPRLMSFSCLLVTACGTLWTLCTQWSLCG